MGDDITVICRKLYICRINTYGCHIEQSGHCLNLPCTQYAGSSLYAGLTWSSGIRHKLVPVHISGRDTITKSIFIAKYSSSRHNVVICSSSSTAWTNFSRLYCHVRQCRSMPEMPPLSRINCGLEM